MTLPEVSTKSLSKQSITIGSRYIDCTHPCKKSCIFPNSEEKSVCGNLRFPAIQGQVHLDTTFDEMRICATHNIGTPDRVILISLIKKRHNLTEDL